MTANSAASFANGAFVTANSAASFANGAFLAANSSVMAGSFANGAFDRANSGYAAANSGAIFANSSFLVANSASSNTITTQGVDLTQNTNIAAAQSFANGAFGQANSAASFANGSFTTANSAASFANGAFGQANSAASFANGAFTSANSGWSKANDAFSLAGTQAGRLNVIEPIAQAAFTNAASALQNTTGTFAGSLTITGSTFAQAMNTTNLQVVGTANVSGTLNVLGDVTMNARVFISNAISTSTQAAVIISATSNTSLPSNDGYMLHISGKPNVPTRIVTDAYGTGAYALLAGRSARGNVDYPSAIQTGDIINRWSGNGYGTTKFQTLGVGRIDFVAAENFTDANTGTQIQFWNCPVGSNTLVNILTLNGDSAEFSGVVKPDKGFIYTPRIPAGNQTAITINYATDSMVKANLVADLTVSHSNFVTGKVVEMWLVNTGGTGRTVTHGLVATNSTTNSTTFNIAATSSAYLKFFSIDGDLANTFVSVVYS